MATAARLPVFIDYDLGSKCATLLEDSAAKSGFNVLAYCFMPDHAHLLIQGNTAGSYLVGFIQRFKQASGFCYKRDTGRQLWQSSFFDRVLRKSEDAGVIADYILDNPRQDGLKLDHAAFALRGGAYYEWRVADGAEATSPHSSSLRSISDDAPAGITREVDYD